MTCWDWPDGITNIDVWMPCLVGAIAACWDRVHKGQGAYTEYYKNRRWDTRGSKNTFLCINCASWAKWQRAINDFLCTVLPHKALPNVLNTATWLMKIYGKSLFIRSSKEKKILCNFIKDCFTLLLARHLADVSCGCFMRMFHALWNLYGNPYRNRAEKEEETVTW